MPPSKGASASWFTTFLPFPISLHKAGYAQSSSWLSCGALVIILDYPTSQTMTEKKKRKGKYRFKTRKKIYSGLYFHNSLYPAFLKALVFLLALKCILNRDKGTYYKMRHSSVSSLASENLNLLLRKRLKMLFL